MRRTARSLVASLLAGTTVVACTATANVAAVYTSIDADGARRRNVFFTDSKEIHCIAEVSNGREDVTLEGIIRQLQVYDFGAGSYANVDRVVANIEVRPQRTSGPPAKIDVALSTAAGASAPGGEGGQETQPYPAGRYQCEILLDGALVGTALFNIDFPPCPTAVIQPGSLCVGYYRPSDACPRDGESTSTPNPPRCTCEPSGWSCP